MLKIQRTAAQKPHLLKIISPPERSFIIKGDEIAWNNPWHFHPEIELLYCIKGKGTNFVGNNISAIEEGELLMFGKNLPHTRQRDKEFYKQHPLASINSVVVQFEECFLGEGFFSVKELAHINNLLRNARRGIKFTGKTCINIGKRLAHLKTLTDTAALLELLSILDTLARSEEFIFLNPATYLKELNDKDLIKINIVYSYTADHYRELIALSEVAALINLTPAAFCRYFKIRTRKSYFQYLTELRITHACELLMEGNLDINAICFASGFNSLSNFHKLFKRIVDLTPSEYREMGYRKMYQK